MNKIRLRSINDKLVDIWKMYARYSKSLLLLLATHKNIHNILTFSNWHSCQHLVIAYSLVPLRMWGLIRGRGDCLVGAGSIGSWGDNSSFITQTSEQSSRGWQYGRCGYKTYRQVGTIIRCHLGHFCLDLSEAIQFLVSKFTQLSPFMVQSNVNGMPD